MSQWNDLSRDRLIKEYHKYPCLWSNKDEDSKNAEKRKECLAQITAELNTYEEKAFTQEEVRTQFKNLRDMYRRKRKKLQLQQEINHSVDEPGWVYFQRLKFLDDSIEFTPPTESSSPVPPPPKKKSKVAASRSDDASLPTPLEDASSTTIISNVAPPLSLLPPPSVPPQHSDPLMMADDSSISNLSASDLLKRMATTAVKMEESGEEVVEGTGDEERTGKRTSKDDDEQRMKVRGENGEGREEQQKQKADETRVTATEEEHQEMMMVQGQDHKVSSDGTNGQQNMQNRDEEDTWSDLAPTQDSAIPASSIASNRPITANKAMINRRRCEGGGGEDEEGEEFAYFGQFVAMALKKMAGRSPIDALETRKEISDVLYRAELRSLSSDR